MKRKVKLQKRKPKMKKQARVHLGTRDRRRLYQRRVKKNRRSMTKKKSVKKVAEKLSVQKQRSRGPRLRMILVWPMKIVKRNRASRDAAGGLGRSISKNQKMRRKLFHARARRELWHKLISKKMR